MLLEFIIARYSAEIMSSLLLLAAVFFSYRLMKEDGGPVWNFILIALSFLAISSIFSVIEGFILIEVVGVLDKLFLMLSSIIFASVLMFAWVRDKHFKVKK